MLRLALRSCLWGAVALLAAGMFSGCTLTVDLDELKNRQCPDGQKLCNDKCASIKSPDNGCNRSSDNGACAPCTLANATPNCANNGDCGIAACKGDYHDCNGRVDDGCEVDLQHDPLHCGSCTAQPCVVPNATPDCAAGRCAIRRCNDNFGDCNNSAGDGCETNLLDSDAHCGNCLTPCPTGMTCSNGTCV